MVMRSARLLLAAPLVGLASTGWLARLPAQADPDAEVKADSAGQATNQLGVVVAGGMVTFLANGKEVYTARAAGLDTQGLVGYRVNHNLDVHLGALVVRKR